MASVTVFPSEVLESILLDSVYQCFQALEVLFKLTEEGFTPDFTEEQAILGTDSVVGQHLDQMYRLFQRYHTATLTPRHRKCQKLLATWHTEYARPDHLDTASHLTTEWVSNTIAVVFGLREALDVTE